jgi:glycosyltransferase involved in cell wall biosynthesis
MTRIVTLTPLPIERDSRTFKQASSMARLGYESVVVEGESSRLDHRSLPFVLRSPSPPAGPESRSADVESSSGVGRRGRLPDPVQRLLRAVVFRLRLPVMIAWFVLMYWPRTARRVPDGSLCYLHSFRQFPAIYLRWRRGTPFIYDAHDFYPGSRAEHRQFSVADRLIERFLLAVERACVRRAAAVVTVGEGVADLIEAEFQRRPVVIRNFHDARIDTPPPRGLRETLGLRDGSFLIATVGNEKPGAATEQAIAALTELPERVHMAFIGAGYDRYVEEIERRDLQERVHLLPPVAPTEVVPFIAGADVAAVLYHALTNDYLYSVPNRFFSAVAAGLPILYPSQLPELSAIAERHELGLGIDPRHPSSVAEGVRCLLDDRQLHEDLRANARRARSELSWAGEEQRLLELINAAMRNGSHLRAG